MLSWHRRTFKVQDISVVQSQRRRPTPPLTRMWLSLCRMVWTIVTIMIVVILHQWLLIWMFVIPFILIHFALLYPLVIGIPMLLHLCISIHQTTIMTTMTTKNIPAAKWWGYSSYHSFAIVWKYMVVHRHAHGVHSWSSQGKISTNARHTQEIREIQIFMYLPNKILGFHVPMH